MKKSKCFFLVILFISIIVCRFFMAFAQTDTIPEIQRVVVDSLIYQEKIEPQDTVVRVDTLRKTKKQLKKSVTPPVNDSILNSYLLRLIEPDTTRFSPEVERALQMVVDYDSLMIYTDTIPINPIFMPIIFSKYQDVKIPTIHLVKGKKMDYGLSLGNSIDWLKSAENFETLGNLAQLDFIVNHPDLIKYNDENLPDIPEVEQLKMNPLRNLITLESPKIEKVRNINTGTVKLKHWISGFQSSIQFSQVHISENWYQGGESNLNLVSNQVYNLKYDDYKKIIFENTIQWKLNLSSAPDDTVHTIRVSEDLFQINSKFGVKAYNKWYYTASLYFKTQLLNNFKANSNDKQAEFFSPGELNLGIGMSYQYKNDKRKLELSAILSPLSYNLRFVLDDKSIDPASFSITEGKSLSQYGSSVETTVKWEFIRNMLWNSRFFYFTNYDRIQIDFENSFDFILNRFFSTRLFLHMRYDDRQPKKDKDTYLQFKELLSFGFNYRF